jgi:hypothetical protein
LTIVRSFITSKGIALATPCMPCSFGLLPHPRSKTGAQPNGLLRVTVADRWIPLVTAAYGTWVARPTPTTMLVPDATAPVRRRVRPVLGDHCTMASRERGAPASRSPEVSDLHRSVRPNGLINTPQKWIAELLFGILIEPAHS